MNVSKIRMAIKNSLNLFLIEFTQEIIQIGAINAVRTMNKTDIPSIPNLNLIKPLIQFFLLKIEIHQITDRTTTK